MTIALFCQFSSPLLDGGLQLSQLISTESAYLLSPDTAIAYVESEDVAASFVLKGETQLDEKNSATFLLAENVTSRFLEILVYDDQSAIEICEIVRKQFINRDTVILSKQLSILIRYPSKSVAIEGYQLLAEILYGYAGLKKIDLVAISEHCVLECQWRSQNNLLSTVERLHRAEQSLRGLIQDALCLWNDMPMIVDAHGIYSNSTSVDSSLLPKADVSDEIIPTSRDFPDVSSTLPNEVIIIICATHRDAQILIANATIELAGGTIVVNQDVKNLPHHETCDIERRSALIDANYEFGDHIASVESVLLTEDDSIEPLVPSQEAEVQVGPLEEEGKKVEICIEDVTLTLDLACYVIANYFKLLVKWGTEAAASTTNVDGSIDGELEADDTLPLWGEDLEGVDEKEEKASSLNVLLDNKAKNYRLLINSSSLVIAERRMERIKRLLATTISMRQTVAMINWCPQHREALNESNLLKELLSKTKAAVLFHESEDRVISADVVALTKDHLKTVFLFLAALIPRQAVWSVPQSCIAAYTAPDWVELRRNYAVKLDLKGADKRMVKGASNSQKGIKFLKVWGFEPSMDKALKFIMTTPPSSALQQQNSGVGSSPPNRKRIVTESQDGRPSLSGRRDSRDFDAGNRSNDSFNTDNSRYGNDRNEEWNTSTKDRKSFNGHFIFLDREAGMFYQAFEKHFQAFLSQSFRIEMKDSDATMSEMPQTVHAIDNSGKNTISRSPATGSDGPSHLQGQNRYPALKIEFSGPTKKDVYSARVYLEKISSTNLSRQQIHFPRYDAARYRELYNHKTKQEANVRMIRREALQSLSAFNSTDGDTDRDPHNSRRDSGSTDRDIDRDCWKDAKGSRLRKGKDSPDSKADRDSFFNSGEIVPDPLLSIGFINIRIRPPLHSRGIRRMTFPADITITVCSPVNTDRQLADYNTLVEHFSSMDSHYITASVEIPLASNMAKQITARNTRDDFIMRHGLVSLRWDENSFRRDEASYYSFLGSVSLDELGSPENQDRFTRGRSISEAKKEDVAYSQVGVAKLWATKAQTMKSALDALCSAEGIITSISMGDNFQDSNNSTGGNYQPILLSDILPPSAIVRKITPALTSQNLSKSLGISTVNSLDASIRGINRERNFASEDSLNEMLYAPISGTIDTPQGLKEISLSEALLQTRLQPPPPGFDSYSPYTSRSGSFSGSFTSPSQPPLLPHLSARDLFSLDSQRLLPPIDFRTSPLTDTEAYSKQEEPFFSPNKLPQPRPVPKQSQTSTATSTNELQQILQTVPLRLSDNQFDPSDYVLNSNVNLAAPTNLSAIAKPPPSSTSQKNSSMNFERSKIQAAPGLTLPTDWDDLFQKVESRTPPSSYIPRSVLPSPTAISLYKQSQPLDLSILDENDRFSTQGFEPKASMPPATLSPKSAFTPIANRDMSFGSSLRKENDRPDFGGLRTSSTLRDSHYFQDAVAAHPGAAPGYPTEREREFQEIYRDSPYNKYNMPLDSSDMLDDGWNLGLQGVESSIRKNASHSDAYSFGKSLYNSSQHINSKQQTQNQLQQQARAQQSVLWKVNTVEKRVVVHWPHSSFRFMFLGDPLKYQLGDLLHKMRLKGVDVSTPLRDKSNPSACLIVEGTNQNVIAASAHIDSYFQSIIHLVRDVKMILTPNQKEILTSADLTRMKEIQGSAGAHIVLDPQMDDLVSCLCCFDIRLPFYDAPMRTSGAALNFKDEANLSPTGEVIPLVALRVISISGHKTDISVIANKPINSTFAGENTWGVSSLIILIDANTTSSFSDEERYKIDRGEILVHCDPITGRTIIRVWPKCAALKNSNSNFRSGNAIDRHNDLMSYNTSEFSRGRSNSLPNQQAFEHSAAEYQARALVDAISEGMAAADAMNLTRIALIAPIGNVFLFALSSDLIRTMTAETAVTFLKNEDLHSLRRVVCVDLSPGDSDLLSGSPKLNPSPFTEGAEYPSGGGRNYGQMKPAPNSGDAALKPASGNRMALTLLLLLEQAITSKNKDIRDHDMRRPGWEGFFGEIRAGDVLRRQSFDMPISAIHLIMCNVALPHNLSAESICPGILLAQQQQSSRARSGSYPGLGQQLSEQSRASQHSENRFDKPCVLVIKGLPVGIIRAVKAIKNLVANRLPPTQMA